MSEKACDNPHRHIDLHRALDELLACYIDTTMPANGRIPSQLLDFVGWSASRASAIDPQALSKLGHDLRTTRYPRHPLPGCAEHGREDK